MSRPLLIIVLAGVLVSCTKQDVKRHDAPAPEATLKGFAKHDGIELRSAQGNHGQPLGTLKPSDDLEILVPDPVPENLDRSAWYRVRFNGTTGWVQGHDLFVMRRERHDAAMERYRGARTEPFLRGSYVSNYEGVPPELELFLDGSCRLTINRCEGMMPVSGEYLVTEGHIVLHGMTAERQTVSRFMSTILDQMVIELAREESGSLLVENDLSYFDGFQRYGSCAPRKGEMFMKRATGE